jgi:hypothetical protein
MKAEEKKEESKVDKFLTDFTEIGYRLNTQFNEFKGIRIGGYKVFCCNKLIRAPDFFCSIATSFLILIPSILQIVFG